MSSFSETVLSFDFAAETPPHVLAAVSALAVPDARPDVPPLPAPVVEEWDAWTPDWRDCGYPEGHGDPFEHEPWRHDWASWVSTSMTVGTTAHGRLVWAAERGRWHLDCRFAWKTYPDAVGEALAWLAPHVDLAGARPKVLVGYTHHEYAPRPHLFWVDSGRWELEDLNPDNHWG